MDVVSANGADDLTDVVIDSAPQPRADVFAVTEEEPQNQVDHE